MSKFRALIKTVKAAFTTLMQRVPGDNKQRSVQQLIAPSTKYGQN